MHTTAMQKNDKNIDICLISPPSRASGITVPIALLYLDSWLTRENIKSKIIDIKHGKPNSYLTPNQIKTVQQKIVKSIVDINPKVVGITCYSTEFWEVIELAQAIRQRIQSQIIVGGIHANIKPEDFFFNDSPINIVVSGDGQEPLVEVITKINSDQDFNGIKGVNYVDKNKEIILQGTASFSRLNELPNPDYSQLDMSYYTQPNPYIIRSLLASGIHIFTTIGCPFLCTFCCNRSRAVKFRPIENVLDEIEHLKINYSIDSFYIQDDTFCLKKSRVREFVNGIQERKLELFWGMETRVNLVDAEILKLIKDAGCIQIDFGVESGSDAALKRMKKGTTNSDTIKAFALCKEHKIRTYANIMFNTPGETTEDVERLRLNKWTDTDMMSFTEWTQIEEWIFIATINPFWKCAKEKSKHFGEEKTTAQLLKDWKIWKEAKP